MASAPAYTPGRSHAAARVADPCLGDAVVPTTELLLPFCSASRSDSGGNTPNTLQMPNK